MQVGKNEVSSEEKKRLGLNLSHMARKVVFSLIPSILCFWVWVQDGLRLSLWKTSVGEKKRNPLGRRNARAWNSDTGLYGEINLYVELKLLYWGSFLQLSCFLHFA